MAKLLLSFGTMTAEVAADNTKAAAIINSCLRRVHGDEKIDELSNQEKADLYVADIVAETVSKARDYNNRVAKEAVSGDTPEWEA